MVHVSVTGYGFKSTLTAKGERSIRILGIILVFIAVELLFKSLEKCSHNDSLKVRVILTPPRIDHRTGYKRIVANFE